MVIRCKSFEVSKRQRRGVLKLSSDEGHKFTIPEVGDLMLSFDGKWIIEGDEPFWQIDALYGLLKYLRERNKNIFIYIKSSNFSYYTLRNISMTDEILDMCDVLFDISGSKINLREA